MGVDFSGGQTGNTTRFTKGVVRGKTLELELHDPLPKTLPATHNKLKELIQGLPNDAVVALDFPFSVPRAFANVLADAQDKNRATQMSDLWGIVAEMKYDRFEKLRDYFVERRGELIRRGDANFGEPFSPLHDVNPVMIKMTYHGMRMLHHLREAGCRVPPLPDANCEKQILLETMPGVLLRIFGLPVKNYKTPNTSNGRDPQKVRREILDGLQPKSGVILGNFNAIKPQCIQDPDQLDSLVAAVGAAMWVIDKSKFLTPRPSIPHTEEIDYAKLEGWIYAPRPKAITLCDLRALCD